MNKQDLVNQIVQNLPSVSKNKAERAVEAFVEIIFEALSKGEDVTLSGFGTFYISERKEKKGVNPRTKEPMVIPAVKVPKFRPSKELKKVVKYGR